MTQTIEAIYQNGMFKPLNPVSEEIIEGRTVEITISEKKLSPEGLLELVGQVYKVFRKKILTKSSELPLTAQSYFRFAGLELE